MAERILMRLSQFGSLRGNDFEASDSKVLRLKCRSNHVPPARKLMFYKFIRVEHHYADHVKPLFPDVVTALVITGVSRSRLSQVQRGG
ncbi:hypothetical protein EVAR_79649_1 [Eumeta japonica]|uniref:Uncharacterized protein n=1 Tax=Eumeta variegata TaxID=151549 RepID=A0A4C1WAA6_EUMVA|nr:hypothetical protein EVAR_79649_1 [Eumeta japonica]